MTAKIEIVLADTTVHNLDQCVSFAVSGSGGLIQVPAKRGGNLVVPGSHGELHVYSKKYQPGTVVLPMWVRGINPDGSIPTTPLFPDENVASRLLYHENLRKLISWFTIDEQVTIRHTLADGTVREITGEVLDTIQPEQKGAGRHTLGTFTVALVCADPFWTDLTDSVETVPATGATTTLGAFADASAPMENLLVEFHGPLSNPKLIQADTGIFVQINRVIPSGQTVTVDTGLWHAYGGGAGLYEALAYGGRGTTRWFALKPGPGMSPPVVQLTHTGVETGGTAVITGRRRYLIG